MSANTHIRKVLLTSTTLAAAGVLTIMPLETARADHAWVLDQQAGSFSTDTTVSDITSITQSTDRAVGVGNLDILGHQTVNIKQNSSESLFVARDDRADPTQILGALNANGIVMVLDQNGVIFGQGSRVDVGGIIASTGDISNDAIMSGADVFEFANVGQGGAIEMNGLISVADAGLAAFVAPTVINNGIINAKLGRVSFAAGDKVTLDLYGDQLVEIAVDNKLEEALVENNGAVIAEGGTVQMTAQAARAAVDNVINMDGVISVASASVQGGKIVLSGGESGVVNVSGTMDASGTEGGEIDVTAEDIHVAETAVFLADGGKGPNGQGHGGLINLIAVNHMDYRGALFARGGAFGGNGGFAEVSGFQYLGYDGYANLSAPYGTTGTLLLDPEFAVVHSGVVNNPLGLGYVLSAEALANSMETANIVVQADEFIDVGTRNEVYNTGNAAIDAILNVLVGTGDIDLSTYDYDRLEQTGTTTIGVCPWFCATIPDFGLVNYSGTTAGDITFQSDTVNFNKNVTMGSGNLGVDGNVVNLDARLYDLDGVITLGEDRLFSNAGEVNVISNSALIQQGIWLSDDAGGADVTVGEGVYNEYVTLDRQVNLTGALTGTDPRDGARDGVTGETVIEALNYTSDDDLVTPLIRVTADAASSTIDGFRFNAFTSRNRNLHGVVRVEAGANDVTVSNNIFYTHTNMSSAHSNLPFELFILGNNALVEQNVFVRSEDALNKVVGEQSRSMIRVEAEGAIIQNNKLDGGPINILRSSGTILIDQNEISNTRDKEAIEVWQTSGKLTISGNVIDGTNYSGIKVFNGTTADTVISGNSIGENLFGTEGVEDGIIVDGVEGAQITGNTVLGNSNIGITVHNSDNVQVFNNPNISNFVTGISVTESDNVRVRNNDVSNSDTGVYGYDAGDLWVHDNDITNSAQFGVRVVDSAGTNYLNDIDIWHNRINTSVNAVGIQVDNSPYASIGPHIYGQVSAARGNVIDGAFKGIVVTGSDHAVVRYNTIQNIGNTAIQIDGSSNTLTRDNLVNTARTGILIEGGNGSSILENVIGYENLVATTSAGAGNIKGDGIEITDSDGATVSGNKIIDTVGDGIYNNSSDGTTISSNLITDTSSAASGKGSGIQVLVSTNVVIGGVGAANVITNADWDGIRVVGGDIVNIVNNTMTNSQRAGIYAEGLTNSNVTSNTIDGTNQFRGISIAGGDDIAVEVNTVDNTARDGIIANGVSNLLVQSNFVGQKGGTNNIGDDGIEVINSDDAQVLLNQIQDTVANGIYINGSNNATVNGNQISTAGANGILVNPSDFVTVFNNTIEDVVETGVKVIGGTGHDIRENTIRRTGIDGIQVTDFGTAWIAYNNIKWTGDDGIEVTDFGTVIVRENAVSATGDNGMTISDGRYAGVFDNRVLLAGDDGIRVRDVSGGDSVVLEGDEEYGYGWSVNVSGNEVVMTRRDGIEVGNSGPTLVQENDVMMAGMGDDLRDNIRTINTFAAQTGVPPYLVLEGSSFDWEWGDGHGINVYGIDGAYDSPNGWAADIRDNRVRYTGGHGILAEQNDRTRIEDNNVRYAGLEETMFYGAGSMMDLLSSGPFDRNEPGRRDLWQDDESMVEIVDAYIGRPSEEPEEPDYDNYVTVEALSFDDHDGIHAEDIYNDNEEGLFALEINNNRVRVTGDDGIEVVYAGRTLIDGNRVRDAGQGFSEDYGSGDEFGADGIHARFVGAETGFSTVPTAFTAGLEEGEGYTYEDPESYGLIITNNDVRRTADDGIEVVGESRFFDDRFTLRIDDEYYEEPRRPVRPLFGGTGRTMILDNVVRRAGVGFEYNGGVEDGYGADGIHVRGVDSDIDRGTFAASFSATAGSAGVYGDGFNGYAVQVIGNDVKFTGDEGVEILGSGSVLIEDNLVMNSRDTGISVNNIHEITISDNDVTTFGQFGINVAGDNNDTVIVAGNELTAPINPEGFPIGPILLNFQSGSIDLTGDGNTFVGGKTGIRFKPTSGNASSLTLIDNDPNDIYEGTLGTQFFQGQSFYFVELDNLALFAPGTPSVYNALNSTFAIPGSGFVTPANSAGVLTQGQFDYLEAKFRHFPDVAALGLFFYGFVPENDLTLENVEDFLEGFGGFDPSASGFTVTITGLPFATAPTAADLANLVTFAGDGDGSELTGDQAAAIETAAGESECFGTALNNAAGGAPVSYSYSGDATSLLQQAENCGTEF